MKFLNNILLLIFVLSLLFLARVMFFASVYGGIEHDSGWYLGEAKNLALRGIYASYTNTVTKDGAGAFPSIHGRYSVQDAQGFVYFPAGITVGPGYVVPEAIILKLFGSGFWQYRAWPLVGFFAMIALTFFVAWQAGGWVALGIIAAWIWFLPQFTTQFAYEAFGEDIACGFLLAGFYLAYLSGEIKRRKLWVMFFSGFSIAAAYLTKNLYILPAAGISGFFIFYFFSSIPSHKIVFLKKWGIFFVGFLLPVLVFRVYEQGFIISHFGNAGWHAVTEDYRISFEINGSGINNMSLAGISHLDWNFIAKKFLVWEYIGFAQPIVAWVLFLILPAFIIKFSEKKYRVLLAGLYTGAFVSFMWFVLFSSMGWARHIWQGLMIAMMLWSICVGSIFTVLKSVKTRVLYLVIIGICVVMTIKPNMFDGSMFLNEQTIQHWRDIRLITGINGFPSNDTFSLADEKNLITFFSANIHKQDRIYYVGWFLNAEVSPLVDKIFYPLDRYFNLQQKNPDGGKSYVIFGHYQQGSWSMEPPSYLPERVSAICEKIVYKNPTYLLCRLRQSIVYTNTPY